MGRFYGKTTKFVRHVTTDSVIIEPQRLVHIPFWFWDETVPAPVDGSDVTTKGMRRGSRVSKHKVGISVTPETNDPQRFFMGMLKFSFHDIYSPYVSGKLMRVGSYQDASPVTSNQTSYIRVWHDKTAQRVGFQTGQIDVTSIDTVRLDDFTKHFLRLKQGVVLNQKPLVSDRFMKVPAKVKRINEGTYYGLWFFNDSPRGSVPADTQLTVDLKQYFEEWAL